MVNQIFFVRILFPPQLISKAATAEKCREEEEEEEDLPFNKMDSLFQRLLSYFEKEKPYLQADLCLNDIAKGIHSNHTYISQLLKQKNISFYDFVNTYRINEVKQRMQNQPNLSCIVEECGFCSYTTFVKYFTKKEGMSPMEWKNRCLKRMV